MPVKGGRWHCSKVGGGVEPREGEVHDLVRLDPPVVHALEPFQVDDQDGREPPDLELLDCQLVRLAGGAVILFILPKFFLLGESLQAFGQGDWLSSSTPVAYKLKQVCQIIETVALASPSLKHPPLHR